VNKLKMDSICFRYKKENIIDNKSLILEGNQCTALIGSNGSGKTTLGKLLMGILKPESGSISYDELNIENLSLSELGSRVGYLFQNPSQQLFAVTVRDDLTFTLRLNGEGKDVIESKLNHVSKLFHLESLIDSKCHLLSQGEKQRVALASIFMREPEYLILDEPTTGLDTVRKAALGDVIDTIKDQNVGILIITHDKKFVNKYADIVIEMESI